MRIVFLVVVFFSFIACKKYKDPKPFTDSRIKNKYCNDPSAINYNWNFPGVPDNNTCIYPAQIFSGNYQFFDTVVNEFGAYQTSDSFAIHIAQIDTVHLQISGFCNVGFFTAKANRFMKYTLDSIIGNGQLYCNNQDTIVGYGIKKDIGDTLSIFINYQLQTDTGVVYHKGVALKK